MTGRDEAGLSYEDFFKMAILRLRDISKSRGIHSVFSDFNNAFREYFGEDPVKVTQELAQKGKIEIRPVKKGVMIYLPGEAPPSRVDSGKKALVRILGAPAEQHRSLLEEVLSEVTQEGIKTFPEDFLQVYNKPGDMVKVEVPGTPLQLDPNSPTIVVSPKRYFRYEAKNPPEAKYIIYAHRIGQKSIKIPKNPQAIFRAVVSYEKYCKKIRRQCFALFLERTNAEDMAEHLTKEVEEKLDLRAKEKQV